MAYKPNPKWRDRGYISSKMRKFAELMKLPHTVTFDDPVPDAENALRKFPERMYRDDDAQPPSERYPVQFTREFLSYPVTQMAISPRAGFRWVNYVYPQRLFDDITVKICHPRIKGLKRTVMKDLPDPGTPW